MDSVETEDVQQVKETLIPIKKQAIEKHFFDKLKEMGSPTINLLFPTSNGWR